MGSSVIPVPSTSGGRSWVELASTTPTAVNAVTFSSLTAYNYYRIACIGVAAGVGGAQTLLRINNDSGVNNYWYSYVNTTSPSASNTTSILIDQNSTANARSTEIFVNYANQICTIQYESVTGPASGSPTKSGWAIWSGATQVNRFDLIMSGGANWAAQGTIKVYGSN